MLNHSENSDKIIPALAAVREKFGPLFKRGNNPFHKSQYVILDDILDMLETALATEGLFIFGTTETRVLTDTIVTRSTGTGDKAVTESGPLALVSVTLRVIHAESGQWLEACGEAPFDSAAGKAQAIQSFGSTVTYLRRYILTTMFNLATESDTDGEQGDRGVPSGKTAVKPGITSEQFRKEWYELFDDQESARAALANHGEWNVLKRNPAKMQAALDAERKAKEAKTKS
jgi:hypothetical protein